MRTQPISILRWFFALLTIEWLLTLSIFFLNPSLFFYDQDISISKLIVILGLLGITISLTAIMLGDWLGKSWTQGLYSAMSTFLAKENVYWIIIVLSGVGLVLNLYIVLAYLTLSRTGLENLFIAPYLKFIWPFALFAIIATIQVSTTTRLLRHGVDVSVFRVYRHGFFSALVSLLIFASLGLLIGSTGLGLNNDAVGWGTPGVPILGIQVLLALVILAAIWGLGELLLSALRRMKDWSIPRAPIWSADLLICLMLWGVAVWLWGMQPLKPTYFSPDPLPPNFVYYPNSDAVHYDLDAIKLLSGIGYDPDAIRPLYVLFLALVHAVSGPDYQSVIAWQVMLYATIPVLIYMLGKSLHHRFTGMLSGILLILREYNAIALAGEINTSNAKLIMADLPITLLVIIYTFIVVRWLQDPISRKLHIVLAGGILALAMLVRVQTAVLLPITLLVLLVFYWRNPLLWLKNGLLLTLTTLIVLSPWLMRTHQVSGMLSLSEIANPTQAKLIGERYSLELQPLGRSSDPSETEGEYVSRISSSALDFTLQHPEIVAQFVANHFMHNQVVTMLVLPASIDLVYNLEGFDQQLTNFFYQPKMLWNECCSLHDYVRALPFWKAWDGRLEISQWLPVFMSTIIVAVGIGIAANQWRLVGLIPLFILLGYSLSNAILRNSGWRYILPADWVGILYYAIGVVQVSAWILTFFANKLVPTSGIGLPEEEKGLVPSGRYPLGKAGAILVGFILIVTVMPVVEVVVPDRYTDTDVTEVLANLEHDGTFQKADIHQETIRTIVKRPDSYLTIGLGIYPRFFEANQGENGTGSPRAIPTSDSRLIFYLANTNRDIIAIPTSEPPEFFPSPSDVLVLGCQMDRYILAEIVVILGDSPSVLSRSPDSVLRCLAPDDDGL